MHERPGPDGPQGATSSDLDVTERRPDERLDANGRRIDAVECRIEAMGDRLSATIEDAFATAIARQVRAVVPMWVVTVAVIAVLAFGLD